MRNHWARVLQGGRPKQDQGALGARRHRVFLSLHISSSSLCSGQNLRREIKGLELGEARRRPRVGLGHPECANWRAVDWAGKRVAVRLVAERAGVSLVHHWP